LWKQFYKTDLENEILKNGVWKDRFGENLQPKIVWTKGRLPKELFREKGNDRKDCFGGKRFWETRFEKKRFCGKSPFWKQVVWEGIICGKTVQESMVSMGSMEFHGFHGIPWNFIDSIEFHGFH